VWSSVVVVDKVFYTFKQLCEGGAGVGKEVIVFENFKNGFYYRVRKVDVDLCY
jgi:hypothetical protein